MIVVCTGCAAKFKVADAKVGPKGAKVRCSKCSTVFLVRRDEPVDAPPPAAPEPAPPPVWVGPPPLPSKRTPPAVPAPAVRPELAAVVRAALDLDLEPPAPRPRPPEPSLPALAPSPPDDPFGATFPPSGHGGPATVAADDPFAPRPSNPDPFAAVQAPIPDDLIRPPLAAPEQVAVDPFDLDPFGGAAEPAPGDDLALEERAPSAAHGRGEPSAPLDDPFGAVAPPLDSGPYDFSAGHPSDIPPLAADLPGAPAPADPPAAPPAPEPLHVDPFASAAVDADPLRVGGPTGRGAPKEAPPPEDEPPPAGGLGRLRAIAVNAVSLAVLLAVALALLVFWRGGGHMPSSLRPASLLAALTQRPEAAGPLVATRIQSGLYERRAGAPLLFVKGEVEARAATAGPVTVTVDLVRGGQVLVSGQARAGAALGPEALHGAADAEALARLVAEAGAGAPAALGPGQAVPFLVPFTDYPGDLAGVAVRVTAAEAGR